MLGGVLSSTTVILPLIIFGDVTPTKAFDMFIYEKPVEIALNSIVARIVSSDMLSLDAAII